MVNRAALILKYKSPAIRWINEADPREKDSGITPEDVNLERTIYLISSADGDTEKTVERWVKRNFKAIFEEELEGWYTDLDMWPQKRTLKIFREWFDVECHTVLIDTVDGAITDDDDI